MKRFVAGHHVMVWAAKPIKVGKEFVPIGTLAEKYGMKYATLRRRLIVAKMPLEDALKKPLTGTAEYPHKVNAYEKRPRFCAECGSKFYLKGGHSVLCTKCKTRTCEQCDKTFFRRGPKTPNRFCDVNCQNEFQKKLIGPLAGNWRGGKKNDRNVAMSRWEYKEWRDAVFTRDDYCCQDCGACNGHGRKVTLNAHHVKEWAKFPKMRFEVDNGVTLCKTCHENRHRRKRK
jgi:5-methylcytosine-specific restriction endonuclease McrA